MVFAPLFRSRNLDTYCAYVSNQTSPKHLFYGCILLIYYLSGSGITMPSDRWKCKCWLQLISMGCSYVSLFLKKLLTRQFVQPPQARSPRQFPQQQCSTSTLYFVVFPRRSSVAELAQSHCTSLHLRTRAFQLQGKSVRVKRYAV